MFNYFLPFYLICVETFNFFQIYFKTKIESNRNAEWPTELSLEILPSTFIPYAPCTNYQNSQYVDICGAQINIQNPASQVSPAQMPLQGAYYITVK